MTEKRFKIVNDCGDYHLMEDDEQLGYDLCSYSMRKTNWNNVVNKLNEQEEEISNLQLIIEVNGKAYRKSVKEYEEFIEELEKENEQLKTELKGIEELLNSYRKTIKHDAELLADATKNGYLPPLGEEILND